MKIIISHDVDHLYAKDHWLRDLVYPKLWVRSVLSALKKDISWKECSLRIRSCFLKEQNCLDSLMLFDEKHHVAPTFFFGMNQGLGMSYYPHEAKEKILSVRSAGFDVGVHGICFDQEEGIRNEYDTFVETVGFPPCGIRMHYVRFNNTTFVHEAAAGYRFDSSEFDKENSGTVRQPYRVGQMWEFPLTIMDRYLPQSFESARIETLNRLEECRAADIEYVTILFHDIQFSNAYSDIRDWYIWLIEYIEKSEDDSFISFDEAIRELEAKE